MTAHGNRNMKERKQGGKNPKIFSFFPLLYHNSIINVRGKFEINPWGNLHSQTCNWHFGLVNCQISSHDCSLLPSSMPDAWRILNLHIHHLGHEIIRDYFNFFQLLHTFFCSWKGIFYSQNMMWKHQRTDSIRLSDQKPYQLLSLF